MARNLWDDPGYASLKSDRVGDLYDSFLPERETKLKVEALA